MMAISKQEKQFREKARKIITQRVNEICEEFGFTYNKIAIRNQKTRLGSCSTKQNLNFNWQITKFPDEARDYVIKHEVAHLKHHNHSKNFWAEVAHMDTFYKKHHKWIRTNGHKYLSF